MDGAQSVMDLGQGSGRDQGLPLVENHSGWTIILLSQGETSLVCQKNDPEDDMEVTKRGFMVLLATVRGTVWKAWMTFPTGDSLPKTKYLGEGRLGVLRETSTGEMQEEGAVGEPILETVILDMAVGDAEEVWVWMLWEVCLMKMIWVPRTEIWVPRTKMWMDRLGDPSEVGVEDSMEEDII